MTYRDLEEELRKKGFGEKLAGNTKPHYGAIQRLREAGYCQSHKGRFATPGNLKKYLEDVAAGRAEDVFAPQLRNKWAEAILLFLEGRPDGATTREVIEHLNTLPEFVTETKGFHDSYVYGIIGKLAAREKLIEPCGKSGKTGKAVIYRLRKSENGAAPTREEIKASIKEFRSGAPTTTGATTH